MSGTDFPGGWEIETLDKLHNRRSFVSGQAEVDRWLRSSAMQSQRKRLTTTKVLVDDSTTVVGFYTLATSQVDFSDLPPEITKKLPRRQLPVAVLAWLAIDRTFQGKGFGRQLLATALRDCHEASETFAFVAIILDCVDESTKQFYQSFDFDELPGHAMRLYLPTKLLDKMMA